MAETKRKYEVYADDKHKSHIETVDLTDEDARYKSTNGFILELVKDK